MNKASQTPEENSCHAVARLESGSQETIREASAPPAERLMPYGAAAKTIFVKANGLAAYNEEFRREHLHCTEQYT